MTTELGGYVRSVVGDMFQVECPEAPQHLRVLYLCPWQVRDARVGDKVLLQYRVTSSQGAWVVVEVMR